VPCGAAAAWTIYVLWGKPLSVQSIGMNLGPAFFFASWMTGQIFRVRKQAGVESSLAAVEQRIQAVTERLEHQTEQLVGHVTGGASFCYVEVGRQGDDQSIWMLIQSGPFPMYTMQVRIVDLDTFHNDPHTGRMSERYFAVDELPVGLAKTLDWHSLGPGDSRRFNIFMNARNGTIFQQILLRRINSDWLLATKIEVCGKIVRQSVDDGFPRDAAGRVEWS